MSVTCSSQRARPALVGANAPWVRLLLDTMSQFSRRPWSASTTFELAAFSRFVDCLPTATERESAPSSAAPGARANKSGRCSHSLNWRGSRHTLHIASWDPLVEIRVFVNAATLRKGAAQHDTSRAALSVLLGLSHFVQGPICWRKKWSVHSGPSVGLVVHLSRSYHEPGRFYCHKRTFGPGWKLKGDGPRRFLPGRANSHPGS
jgi:hypothetical protein